MVFEFRPLRIITVEIDLTHRIVHLAVTGNRNWKPEQSGSCGALSAAQGHGSNADRIAAALLCPTLRHAGKDVGKQVPIVRLLTKALKKSPPESVRSPGLPVLIGRTERHGA